MEKGYRPLMITTCCQGEGILSTTTLGTSSSGKDKGPSIMSSLVSPARSALVRKHKVAYVACPKPQKGTFSKLIYDEIKARNPPGRFLKQHPKTKLWHVIGEKKALDKTRQALREGAPDIQKELVVETSPPTNQPEYTSVMPQHAQHAYHAPNLHTSPVKVSMGGTRNTSCSLNSYPLQMAQHLTMIRGAPNQGFQISPTRYDQYASSLSPLPHHPHAGFMPIMHQGTMNQGPHEIVLPALFPPPFQNQSLQRSPTYAQQHSMQNYGQQQQPQMHMAPTPGTHTVRPNSSQMNMPIPNMNTSAQIGRPRWENVRSISMTEENEDIAPLASESKYSTMFSTRNGNKETQDHHHQGNTSSLDAALTSDYRSNRPKATANNSQRSLMSLSVDGMGTSQDLGDTNYLSALFNSSLKISGNKPSAMKTNATSSSQLSGTMEMSVNTLEGDQLSDFGDSAFIKMTESQAEMSFGNVFEER